MVMRRSPLLHAIRSLRGASESLNWVCTSCKLGVRRTASRRSNATLSAPPSKEKPFYVTTPIFYVNADPHIGHLYSMVLADILKRHAALRGQEAVLLTGTDEHGMKVQRAAEKAGIDPKAFCDRGAEIFKQLADQANVSYTRFMRTTDQDHKDAVQHAWQMLQEKDMIYSSKHQGWYAVSDEAFYPPAQVHLVVEPWSGRKHMASVETGKEVEWTEEENYLFRLSAFRDRLLDFYETNPNWIQPPTRHREVLQWIKDGLQDLSISRPRSRLTWGLPVPGDSTQTMYVWLEALMNYVTAAGYPWAPTEERSGGWPADVQVIGKDITRFHCIYWPALLMALELPIPRLILSHAHWTLGNEKMSKSIGNVVNPFFAMDRFGVDELRFFLARDGGIKDDAKYDNDLILQTYNKDLKGLLGNMLSRLTRSKKWSIDAAIKAAEEAPLNPLKSSAHSLQHNFLVRKRTEVDNFMLLGNVRKALDCIMSIATRANVWMTHQEPWALADAGKTEELNLGIYSCAEALRITSIMLQPFMPEKSATLLDVLGVQKERRSWKYAYPGEDYAYGRSFVEWKGHLFPPQLSDTRNVKSQKGGQTRQG